MSEATTFFAQFDDKNPQSVKYDCWDISGSRMKILGILHQSAGWAEQRIAQAPPSTIQGIEFDTKGMMKHMEPFLVQNYECLPQKPVISYEIKSDKGKEKEKEKEVKESKGPVSMLPINVYVQNLLQKAISGDSEKPYCKHCECEFANTGNLHKHYKNAVACNKLAHAEFQKLFVSIS